jgi:hypothetical protein
MFVFTAAESHAHLKKHEEFMSSVREGNVEDIQQLPYNYSLNGHPHIRTECSTHKKKTNQ